LWRGTTFDPLARGIVRDAIAGRYEPLYETIAAPRWDLDGIQMTHEPVRFSDDFMRNPDEGMAWKTDRGHFGVTGAEPADASRAFSLRAEGKGLASSSSAWSNPIATGRWSTCPKRNDLRRALR